VPLLRGERPSWRSSVLIEYYSDTVFPRIRNMGYQAVRTERYKYINYLELEGMDEIYDLSSDPYEMDNLMGAAREQELLPMLRQELARLQEETGYRMPATIRE
jgi:N-acetylglucosamine-6-sulfatase